MKTPVEIEQLPFGKRILRTGITVDCFHVPVIGCSHYFLSHFHADHYTGLKRSFTWPVFCSETTANLVESKIGAKTTPLEMNKPHSFETFTVTLLEANHCPGAVCFIFLIDGQFVLHTGDFRYHRRYHTFPLDFACVYFDNTYEDEEPFPSQAEAIRKVLQRLSPGKLVKEDLYVLCCAYCIGKERVFLSIAEYLNERVQVTSERHTTYKCYSRYSMDIINNDVLEIVLPVPKRVVYFKNTQDREMRFKTPFDRLTTEEAKVRVIGIQELKRLDAIVSKIQADRILVLCGSGWTEKVEYKTYTRPDGTKVKRGVEIVHFRYSEHSSPAELDEFRDSVRAGEIVPLL